MKTGNLALTLILILYSLPALPLYHARTQDTHTFSGHIKTKATAKTSTPQFSIKLYPPKGSNKPILMTSTDDSGDFEFTGLTEKSHLLEIYLGTDLVYQEVIEMDGSLCCDIDLSGETIKRQCPCASPRRRH